LPVYLRLLAIRHSSAGMTLSDGDGTVSKSVTLQEGAGKMKMVHKSAERSCKLCKSD
jgi:hypothetical protein